MKTIYFLFLIAFIACNSSDKSDVGSHNVPKDLRDTYNEVLAIHDEVMPKMSELTRLQGQLTEKLKELRSVQPPDSEKLRETNRVLGQLNRAESAMWDWMDGFSKLDSIPDPEKENFLLNEKSSAEDMKELMLTSMKDATKYLEENPLVPSDAI